MTNRIAVIGGGFAGLWGAVSAARSRDLFGIPEDEMDIVLVAPDPFHTIRVRCYEADLAPVRVPLDEVLSPVNVRRIEGRVTRIDPTSRTIAVAGDSGAMPDLGYDRLILAAGSSLRRPPIEQAQETFDVDTYDGARRLAAHLAALPHRRTNDGVATAVVIGGGLVGIEIACELPDRLRAALGTDAPVRVVVVDHNDVGAAMGEGSTVVSDALASLGVEVLPQTRVAAVGADDVVLSTGEHIPAATIVFATGMRASPLTRDLAVPCDRLGRLAVNAFLEVTGVEAVYAAGAVDS